MSLLFGQIKRKFRCTIQLSRRLVSAFTRYFDFPFPTDLAQQLKSNYVSEHE